MYSRRPDLEISVPVTYPRTRGGDKPAEIGLRIDTYFWGHGGVRVSEFSAELTLRYMAFGGQAIYHVKNKGMVSINVVPEQSYPLPKSCGIQIFVEGEGKSELVRELEAQLAEFKIPVKV